MDNIADQIYKLATSLFFIQFYVMLATVGFLLTCHRICKYLRFKQEYIESAGYEEDEEETAF